MPKVEIDFDAAFDTGNLIAKHLGRINIGSHIARFLLSPEGKTILVVSKKAIEDGSIKFIEDISL